MHRKKKHLSKRSLVLNADYTCICLISIRQAMSAYIKNMYYPDLGLQAVDFYNDKILTCGGRYFPVPSVLRSVTYIKPKGMKVPFKKKNVFLRDNMTCAYCGHQDKTGKDLNIDHVVPRVIWNKQNHKISPTNWQNVVACCYRCNSRKRDRTPEQANMKLKIQPFEPNPHNHISGFSPWMRIEEDWLPYLPKNYKNLGKI